MINSRKKTGRAGLKAAICGGGTFAVLTVATFICSHFLGQQHGEPLNFFDYCRAGVGMPSFYLFGGVIVNQLTAAFICVAINAVLGAITFFSLAFIGRRIWLFRKDNNEE